PSERKILFLRVSPAGDVQLDATMDVPGHPRALQFAALDEDAFPDLVAPADEGTIVSMGAGPFTFTPPVLLGPGASAGGWALADVDGDGKVDFVAAEKHNRRLVLLANAGRRRTLPWPSSFAAGNRPRGVIAADLDGDGLTDIAVANAGSSSVTLLFNRGEGRFSGGATAAVAERPSSLKFTPSSGSTPGAVVSSHSTTETLGVLPAADFPRSASFIAIPTGARPHVLECRVDSASLEIILRYRGDERHTVALSVFQQIGGGQFLERSMHFAQGENIAAATMEPAPGRRAYAVGFVTSSAARGASTLQVADVTPSFVVGKITPELTFSDSAAAVSGILPATLRQGGGRDYIVVLGKPVNALLIAYRQPDGSFRSDPEWIRNVTVTGDDDVVVEDVDGDGRPDITVRDEASASILTYYGGALGFGTPVRVAPAKGVGGFALGHIATHRGMDLVLTHEDEGTVSIVADPFRRRP
ncbi:MAG TPA: VCBS repeat-containing protein, partial [Bacteroidota bacterium]|nr:VCBS repeat-containing protein [Bacteroidota bacterium]